MKSADRNDRRKYSSDAVKLSTPKSVPAVTTEKTPPIIKADKYATGISRTFWIILAFSAAAVVLGMGRNEAFQYQNAVEELRAISKFSRSVSVVEDKLNRELRDSIAVPLVRKLSQAAAKQNTSLEETDLVSKIKFYWIEKGSLSFNFSAPPSDLLKQIDELLLNEPYIIKIPADPTITSDLKDAVEDILRRDAKNIDRKIVDAEFSCNWANNQCASELVLKGELAGENVRRLKFFVPARQFVTPFGSLDVLGFPDIQTARRLLQVNQIRGLENELAGKSFDQSLVYLTQQANQKEGSIKVFDVAFSGATAFLVLPLAIVGSLGWLLLQLRELGSLPLRRDDLRGEAMEIFYEEPTSARMICIVLACAPIAALSLLIRIAPSNRLDVIAVIIAATLCAGILSYLILSQRNVIRRHAEQADPL